MTLTHVFAPITKTEKQADGTLKVFGKATGPDLDIDEQICDPAWLARAMPDWMKWANVREQHTSIAAGVGTTLEQSGEDWMLESLVVDAGSIKKVERDVLKGYSIGIRSPKIVKDAEAPNGRIVGGTIVEVSLVDRPANPTCTLMIAKSVGGTLVKAEDPTSTEVIVGNVDGTDPAAEVVDVIALVARIMTDVKTLLATETAELVEGTGGYWSCCLLLDILGDLKSYAYEVAYENTGEIVAELAASIKAVLTKTVQEDVVKLSTIADLVKAATTGEDEAEKAAVIELRKVLGVDDEIAAIKAEVDECKTAVEETKATTAEALTKGAAELAKVKEMAAPGGPALMAPPPTPQETQKLLKAAKAAEYRRLAETVNDRRMADAYRQLAAEAEAA